MDERERMKQMQWMARVDKNQLLRMQEDIEQMRDTVDREIRAKFAQKLANAYLDTPCTDDAGCVLDGEHYTPLDVAYILSMAIRTNVLGPIK